jgi:hypothetical protein
MEGATLLAAQVVAFVVENEVDHSAAGQGRRFIKDQGALLDARGEHVLMTDPDIPGRLRPHRGAFTPRSASLPRGVFCQRSTGSRS